MEKDEIKWVKALGEHIGYGNMMNLASALWAIDLQSKGVPENGAFLSSIDFLIKPDELPKVQAEQQALIDRIKNMPTND